MTAARPGIVFLTLALALCLTIAPVRTGESSITSAPPDPRDEAERERQNVSGQEQSGARDRGNGRLVMAQIHRLEGATAAEIDGELARIRKAGFNTLILRVFQNRGDRFHALTGLEKGTDRQGVYFATGRAPVVADLVSIVAPRARAQGLKIYAWITTRHMDWLDRPEWRDISYHEATGLPAINAAHDLFNTGFLDYLLALLADLADSGVDGIILQDDFVILTREGLTPAGLDGFRRATGSSAGPADLFSVRARPQGGFSVLPGSKLFARWSVYKADHLRALGERIARTCRAVRPDIEVCINVYADTILDPGKGRDWFGQDLEAIIGSTFDRVLLMAYHRQLSHERGFDVTEAIATLTAHSTELQQRLGHRLIVKLEARDWRTGEEPGDAEFAALAGLLPAPDTNIAFAPVERESALFRRLGAFIAGRRSP